MSETSGSNAPKGESKLSPGMEFLARAMVAVLIAVTELIFSLLVVGVSRFLFGAVSIRGPQFLILCALGVVLIFLRKTTPDATFTMQERLRWAIARLLAMFAAQTVILHYWS